MSPGSPTPVSLGRETGGPRAGRFPPHSDAAQGRAQGPAALGATRRPAAPRAEAEEATGLLHPA